MFASKGKYNWVGEDILLLQPMEPLYYSVIAQGRVVALEISKVVTEQFSAAKMQAEYTELSLNLLPNSKVS